MIPCCPSSTNRVRNGGQANRYRGEPDEKLGNWVQSPDEQSRRIEEEDEKARDCENSAEQKENPAHRERDPPSNQAKDVQTPSRILIVCRVHVRSLHRVEDNASLGVLNRRVRVLLRSWRPALGRCRTVPTTCGPYVKPPPAPCQLRGPMFKYRGSVGRIIPFICSASDSACAYQ